MRQFLCYEKTGNRFLKKLGISIFFLFFTLGLKAQCPAGNVSLTSQTAVDAFATNYPNCTEISGDLHISGSTITDLSPLSNLTSVGGYLRIYNNSNLINLNGLSNLTSVGGFLRIDSNLNLNNLDGLSNLTSVGGYLYINSNSSLTDLDGLSNLTSVGADLVIQSNSSLTDISGLQNIDPASILSTNGFGLYIKNNSSLSVCNLENFCTYLAGSGARDISGNAGDCISEDAVTTACVPACDAPTNLTATNITSVSATLGWTSDGNNFDIEWGTQGFTQGSGTLVTDIATNSYNLTNLDYNTQYQFYIIRQDCTVNESDWTGPFSFTTLPQCPAGDVILTSQTEIDDFATDHPNCTEVSGTLTIQGANNLTPLSNLTSVGGDLYIISNLSLDNLDGLSNLTSVGGNLFISTNSSLPNLDGLSNLTSVGGTLYITYNLSLDNLDGLSNLTSVGADLVIEYNSSLTDISGLQNIDPASILSTYGFGLYIKNNSSLSVCNLENFCTYLAGSGPRTILDNAGDCISEAAVTTACDTPCDTPTNLTATNITSVSATLGWTSDGNNFDIEWGTQGFTQGSGTLVTDIATNSYNLTNLDYNTQYQFYIRQDCTVNESDWAGPFSFTTLPQCPAGNVTLTSQAEIDDFATDYPNCTEVSGNLIIQGDNITNLTPLSNLTSVGGYLYIYDNLSLTNLDGLSNLTSVGGLLLIESNPNLTNLNGLSNLTSVGGYLYIYNNSNLTNLNGLSNLTSLGGHLYISNNSNLTNLNGLSNLTSIGGYLAIESNPSLTDISGLQNIDPTSILSTYYGEGLYIVGNTSLSVCNLPNFCTYLQGSGLRTISGNAGDCISEAAVTTACVPACDAPTNLTATNITSVSATLGWTSDGNNFDIEWGTQGFTQGSGTLVTDIATNSYNLTNLDYNTQYQFYIRQDCTVNESDWAGPFSFTTLPQCPAGNVSLKSQADIDAFATDHPNCTEVSGNLTIQGANITDLTPLSNLTSVGGYLFIYSNSSLANLDGLNNLTSVGGYLSINSNLSLTNLDGLSNLTSLGGHLYISNNSNLTNLDGLSNLTSVGADLVIQSNSSLTDISGLQNIDPASILSTSTYGLGLYIVNNPLLSVCNLPNFCTYLQGSGARIISDNAGDCVSVSAIQNACDLSGNCDSYTIWNGTDWSNGIPNQDKRAIIEGDLTLTEDLTACELLLNSGILTVNSGVTLTVKGVIENTQSATNFIVENGANLIQTDDVDNIGAITVYKNSSDIKHLDYTIWSSPVEGQGLKAFSPQTLWYRIYTYTPAADPANDQWSQVFDTSSDPDQNFEQGIGYMFRAPNDFVTTPYTYNGEFTGVPNNGGVTVNFTTTGKYQSLGNPYPSSISTTDLQTETDLGTLYFWTNTNPWDDNQGNYTANNWATYNGVGGVAAANDTKEPNAFIPTGQGFVADTEIAPNTYLSEVTFTNAMRTSNEGVFFKVMEEEKHRLWLNLSDEQQMLNQTLIGYVQGATQELDYGIDAQMFGYSGSALYSLIENTENNFVIQGRALPFDDNDVVQLGFRANQAGSFTISLSDFDGIFAEGQDIYLKDSFTQTEHNLKEGSYEFISEEGVFHTRFEITYKPSGDLNADIPNLNNHWVVYKKDNVFHIHSRGFEMKEVVVYDVLGRVVYSNLSEGNIHILPYLGANQVLIVKITTTHDEVTSKKISNN